MVSVACRIRRRDTGSSRSWGELSGLSAGFYLSRAPALATPSSQVLEYEIGQEYKAHFDYFFHKEGSDNGGNRMATVLMYLATPEEGGETIFPNAPAPEEDDPT